MTTEQHNDHTAEPWVSDGAGFDDIDNMIRCLEDDKGTDREWQAIGISDEDGYAESVAYCHPMNAPRITGCVNGCKGIQDPANTVPELIEALKEVVDSNFGQPGGVRVPALARAREILSQCGR